MKSHSGLLSVTVPIFIIGQMLALAGIVLQGWVGNILWILGSSIVGGTVGAFGYWLVVELLEARQKRELARQLCQARRAKGLTYEQVWNLTHIDVAKLELQPESLSYASGTLTRIAQELSKLYGQPISVGPRIA